MTGPALSYGQVKGYEEHGKSIAWSTPMGAAFKHAEDHSNKPPYQLPKSWRDAQGKFDETLPLDVVNTTDIIGGNSRSPVVNTKGELLYVVVEEIPRQGLNIAVEDDPDQARAMNVDSRAILESLGKIYHADGLYEEIRAVSGLTTTTKL